MSAAEVQGRLESGPDTFWINAMQCVVVTDDFAATVGRALISKLMREGQPKVEPLDPFRALVLRVVCS